MPLNERGVNNVIIPEVQYMHIIDMRSKNGTDLCVNEGSFQASSELALLKERRKKVDFC